MTSTQILLPVEEIVEDYPQCDAFWHPRRCLLPAQHPDVGNVPGWSTDGHFYGDENFADWAELHPWNAAWEDVHAAFWYTARRQLQTRWAEACLQEWDGGPPAPEPYSWDPQAIADPEVIDQWARIRLLDAEEASGGLGNLPNWTWGPAT